MWRATVGLLAVLLLAVVAAGADAKTKEAAADDGDDADTAPVHAEFVTCGRVFRL